jgi:glucosyl-dolichyl phosphate glucuronosyltransferase
MNSEYKKIITIIICTYNRADILEECLHSLAHQTLNHQTYDVLVIDNNSTDNTHAIAHKFAMEYANFRVVKETRQGLSHARNRGYQESSTPWVSYVDDDAKAYPNYVERALWVIEHFDFDCFGGIYYAWHKYGRPRWLPAGFGDKPKIQEEVGLMEEGFASGGVIVFRKNVLAQLGGFPTELGMKGNKISYGEETYLQIKMREKGYKLGFDPELKIDHLVAKYKLNPWWHVKSHFKRGETSWDTFGNLSQTALLRSLFIKSLKKLFKGLKENTPKLLQSNYYLESWFIETMNPFAYQLGKFWGAYQTKKKIKSNA